jgi:hypothetical protein
MIDAIVFAAAVAAGPTTAGTATSAVVSAARIPSRWQDFAACVVKRESGGRRNAQNPTSSAQGLYQFLDSQWRHGLPYMVTARLREAGMSKAAAKSLRIKLQATPIKACARSTRRLDSSPSCSRRTVAAGDIGPCRDPGAKAWCRDEREDHGRSGRRAG